MRTPRLHLAALCAAACIATSGCGINDEVGGPTIDPIRGGTIETTSSTTPPPGDWVAYPMWCSQPDFDSSELMELGRGDVVALPDPAATLTEALCEPGDGEQPPLDAERTWYAVGTAADRLDIELTGTVTGGTGPARLDFTWSTPARDCGVTADWRGHLIAVVAGPADAQLPEATVNAREVSC